MSDKKEQLKRIDAFHSHLDICAQCRNHPFDLCSTGARLLQEAATEPRDIDEIIADVKKTISSIEGRIQQY